MALESGFHTVSEALRYLNMGTNSFNVIFLRPWQGKGGSVRIRYAADFGADLGELLFNTFIATIDVIDAVDEGFAFRG